MRIDANLSSPPVERAGELAAAAEAMGFDGVWATEMTHSPFVLATLAADATDRLDVGTGIALAFPRSPMVTAYTAWDLAGLSGGRFVLGLGTQVKGHIERRYGVAWDRPGPRLRDYVRALRAIWDAWAAGEEPAYEGEFYEHTLCPPTFRPDPIDDPHVPIYVAGVNPFNLKLAGEHCDGLFIHPLHSPAYVEEVVVPNVAEGAALADRDPDEVTLATTVMAVVGDTEAERDAARERVRQQIAFYASTRTYRSVLEVHGWGDVVDALHERSVAGEWGAMSDLVSDEMVAAFAVEAPWDGLRDAIEARYDHLDRVAVYAPFRGEDHWRALVDGG